MTGEGFIDTLTIISGIDLHGGRLAGLFNPFAAVPSMHFGYALMIGVVVAVLVRHWALRLLVLMYPLLVFVTIVGTANHYVVDALAGGAVMLVAFGLTAMGRTWRARARGARASSDVCHRLTPASSQRIPLRPGRQNCTRSAMTSAGTAAGNDTPLDRHTQPPSEVAPARLALRTVHLHRKGLPRIAMPSHHGERERHIPVRPRLDRRRHLTDQRRRVHFVHFVFDMFPR